MHRYTREEEEWSVEPYHKEAEELHGGDGGGEVGL